GRPAHRVIEIIGGDVKPSGGDIHWLYLKALVIAATGLIEGDEAGRCGDDMGHVGERPLKLNLCSAGCDPHHTSIDEADSVGDGVFSADDELVGGETAEGPGRILAANLDIGVRQLKFVLLDLARLGGCVLAPDTDAAVSDVKA